MQNVAGLAIRAALVAEGPIVTVGGEMFSPVVAHQVANVVAQLGRHDLPSTARRPGGRRGEQQGQRPRQGRGVPGRPRVGRSPPPGGEPPGGCGYGLR
jgi:hypothetical protein